MKNFRYDTISNIAREPQEIQKLNCAYGSLASLQDTSSIAVKAY